jgi:DNA-binding TFAR19-related protein (PDSD5 family)
LYRRASRHKRASSVQQKKYSGATHRQEISMTRSLSRLLKAIQKPDPASRSRLTDLHVIRGALAQCVEDCQGIAIDRLSLRIASARTHQELWLLRSDAYRLIALSHCQSVAAQRIGGLLPHFDGWIAPQEVRRAL